MPRDSGSLLFIRVKAEESGNLSDSLSYFKAKRKPFRDRETPTCCAQNTCGPGQSDGPCVRAQQARLPLPWLQPALDPLPQGAQGGLGWAGRPLLVPVVRSPICRPRTDSEGGPGPDSSGTLRLRHQERFACLPRPPRHLHLWKELHSLALSFLQSPRGVTVVFLMVPQGRR